VLNVALTLNRPITTTVMKFYGKSWIDYTADAPYAYDTIESYLFVTVQ